MRSGGHAFQLRPVPLHELHGRPFVFSDMHRCGDAGSGIIRPGDTRVTGEIDDVRLAAAGSHAGRDPFGDATRLTFTA